MCICGSIYSLAFVSGCSLEFISIRFSLEFYSLQCSYENLFQSSMYAILLFFFSFDIFMVMYFGNEIELSSDRLSYCLFESDWFEQSRVCKKCIIMLAELLKRPHALVVGRLYPLNLDIFTSVSSEDSIFHGFYLLFLSNESCFLTDLKAGLQHVQYITKPKLMQQI